MRKLKNKLSDSQSTLGKSQVVSDRNAMAIIGHWLFAFPFAYLAPEASVALLCKCTMISDVMAGVFLLAGVETGAVFDQWMDGTPPPSTLEMIEGWKKDGKWDEGVDLMPGEVGSLSPFLPKTPFKGFAMTFSTYVDISYSHSVELMAIFAVCLIIFLKLKDGISAKYALVIFVAFVSHPMVDMVFHDAFWRMGDRTKTRVSIGLWQIPYNGPFTFALECIMCYFPYKMWLDARVPVADDEETKSKIAEYKGMFWQLALTHNMASWYVATPCMLLGFYKWAPSLQFATPYAYWSYAMFFMTFVSWSGALYPIHMMEKLTVAKGPAKAREPLLKTEDGPSLA